MTVIINELEHVPPVESRPEARRGDSGESPAQNGSPAAQQAQVMATIRRDASRQARLWAD